MLCPLQPTELLVGCWLCQVCTAGCTHRFHFQIPTGRYAIKVIAVGESSVILLHPPPPFSRRFNRDGEGVSVQ